MEFKSFNRYIIYFFSLFLISLGGSLSIKANLGTSPLLCLPYVTSLIAKMSVGEMMLVFNIILIFLQIILLRKEFEKRQLLQLVVGSVFSAFVNVSLMLVSFVNPTDYISQMIVLLVSCVVIAFGVLLEIQTEIVYLPPDGIIVAISKVIKREFAKVKPFVDTSFVVLAAGLSLIFLGYLAGVREGTVISAVIIGPIVKVLKKYFDSYIIALIE